MPSSTVEDYIKQLYHEQQATPGELVPMGRLAEAMNVVPGTVTTMIKALADSGLVSYEPRAGVTLTRGGEQLAQFVDVGTGTEGPRHPGQDQHLGRAGGDGIQRGLDRGPVAGGQGIALVRAADADPGQCPVQTPGDHLGFSVHGSP